MQAPLPLPVVTPQTADAVATASRALRDAAERVGLAMLDDRTGTTARLLDAVNAAETEAVRWLLAHAPHLAGGNGDRRERRACRPSAGR